MVVALMGCHTIKTKILKREYNNKSPVEVALDL